MKNEKTLMNWSANTTRPQLSISSLDEFEEGEVHSVITYAHAKEGLRKTPQVTVLQHAPSSNLQRISYPADVLNDILSELASEEVIDIERMVGEFVDLHGSSALQSAWQAFKDGDR